MDERYSRGVMTGAFVAMWVWPVVLNYFGVIRWISPSEEGWFPVLLGMTTLAAIHGIVSFGTKRGWFGSK